MEELSKVQSLFRDIASLSIFNVEPDNECEEYYGYNLHAGTLHLKFRKAKITPKKLGYFVTLWKRNSHGQTEPFSISDHFDFYIIAAAENNRFGIFIFPRNILVEKQILTNSNKEGKRGFRVYTNWNTTENKQAEKTKNWQKNYFINLSDLKEKDIDKFKSILQIDNYLR